MRQFMLIHGPGYGITPNIGPDYEARIVDEWEMADILSGSDPDDYDRKGIEGLSEADSHLLEHPLAPHGAFGVVLRLLDDDGPSPGEKAWSPRR
jgi:hypothetical protein